MTENKSLSVSVIEPVGLALERVMAILFKPFDIEKWFIIGFCAWLSGFSGGFNFNFFTNRSHHGSQVERIRDAFQHNLPMVITFASIFFVVGLSIMILSSWLSSRGRFMFLYSVAKNQAEVKIPWKEFRKRGNSLFAFRIVTAFLFIFCLTLSIGSIVVFAVLIYLQTYAAIVPLILAIVFLSLITIPAVIAFLLLFKFTTDFVVPIMYLQNISCTAAWRQFLRIFSANKARFVLYILVQIVISMAISAVVFTAILMTCCCAACFLMIPYIGTVLILPLLVFSRLYSLYYLRQYGPEFDVFATQPLAQTAPPTTS